MALDTKITAQLPPTPPQRIRLPSQPGLDKQSTQVEWDRAGHQGRGCSSTALPDKWLL